MGKSHVHPITPAAILLLALAVGADCLAATVNGRVVIPSSTGGWQASPAGMRVRVEGTDLSAEVNAANGAFTLSNVPPGVVTLLVAESGQDMFTAASRRAQVQVAGDSVSDVNIPLAYHWQEIPAYPDVHGQPGYEDWSPQFVSAEVGFILFRVAAVGTDSERMELYRTVDGARSWSMVNSWLFDATQWQTGTWPYPDRSGRSFHFIDANHGVVLAKMSSGVCGEVGVGFFQTQDGGQSWGYAPLPLPANAFSCNVQRYAWIPGGPIIAAGTVGCRTAGYTQDSYDAIWESSDAGGTWQLAAWWQAQGDCTGLGAGPDGSAAALYTPYAGTERRLAVRDPVLRSWRVMSNDDIVTNSGYGPADLPFVDRTVWASSLGGNLGQGLFRSESSGAFNTWSRIADVTPQYMDFASASKGFGIIGGSMYVTYDGGSSWLYQAPGGILCCHGNDIWAFGKSSAIWHEGGAGDPNARRQLHTYVEPALADFEIVPGFVLPDGIQRAGDQDVPVASYRVVNQGTVPITVMRVTFHAAEDSPVVGISMVELWNDADASGNVTAADTLLSQGTYAGGDSLHLSAGYLPVEAGVAQHLLVTCDFSTLAPLGVTYRGYLVPGELLALRADNGQPIAASAPAGQTHSSRSLTIGDALFADDFENALTNWVATTDDPVPDAGYGWGITDSAAVSRSRSSRVYDDRNHSGYAVNSYLTLVRPLNLAPAGRYWLTLYHRYRLDPSFVAWVEISTDEGQTWSWVGRYGSYDTWGTFSTGSRFAPETIDISHLAGRSQVLVRFRFDWTAGRFYSGEWLIDDVRLFRIPAAGDDDDGDNGPGPDNGGGGQNEPPDNPGGNPAGVLCGAGWLPGLVATGVVLSVAGTGRSRSRVRFRRQRHRP